MMDEKEEDSSFIRITDRKRQGIWTEILRLRWRFTGKHGDWSWKCVPGPTRFTHPLSNIQKRATNEYTRSIRIQGHVQRVSEEESTAYFHSRPPASQIGAWASPHQSAEVKGGRDELESNAKEIENRFKAGGIGKDSCGEGQNGKSTLFIPKPDFWGGYRVVPDTFEFWEVKYLKEWRMCGGRSREREHMSIGVK